ncbi:TonB-dependent receptor domain-containing protein [Aurantiacibacter flavus]|uniref:TonB-dependent receptor n=1 Tax=Aurantiacibacter flavus TaxID=3145232 RepID=A0ABV0CYB5_9SPHN
MRKFTKQAVYKAALMASGTSVLLAASPALAQDNDTSEEEARIVVTGSRIQRQDYQSNSPIVTVGSELLENSSTSSVEVNLNRLPQFVPEKTPTLGGDIQATPTNTPGSATVSLRGIGSNRNLVLLDGRRATPGNASMAVDINTIPSAAIERVEIISGGASSTYGADAVGGVVNFILKKNFEGLEVSGQYNMTERGDGGEYQLSAIMGTNFADGRGNISLAVSTSDRNASYRTDRPWYQELWANPDVQGNYFFPIYSGIQQTGENQAYQDLLNSYFPDRTGNVSATGNLYFLGDLPFTFGNSAAGASGVSNFPEELIDGQLTVRSSLGTLTQNFQEDYINLPLSRYNFYTRGNYDISDNISFIAQGYFSTTHSETVQQPGPIVGGWNVVIPRYLGRAGPDTVNGVTYNDADWLPSTLVSLLDARTDPTAPYSITGYVPGLGNRETITDNYTYNLLAGFEGTIPNSSWSWDITGQRGESVTNFLTTGVASLQRLRAVMSAPNFGAGFSQTGNPTGGFFGAGQGTCTTGLNPFTGATPSADCVQAVNADLKETGIMRQTVFEANLQGGLFELPAGEVLTAVGATYRDNHYIFREDTLKERNSSFLDQALGIYPAQSIDAKLMSHEIYGEISVPVLHNVPGIDLLELVGGIRYADSNITGGSTTWKIEANWEVTEWLRLRGGYNKAERAPNVGELYSLTQNFGLLTGGDGCSVGNPFPYSANPNNANGAQVEALCRQLMDKTNIPGQPANSDVFYGRGNPGDPDYIAPSAPSQSTSTAPGVAFPYYVGNPNLTNENAKTWTVGVVLESPLDSGPFSNMRLAVDYYNIQVDDAIGLLSGQTLQQLCLDPVFNPTFDPNSFACNNFQRGTGGGIGAVRLAYTNSAAFKTSGIDAQLDWAVDVGTGRLALNTVFNYLIEMSSSPFYSGVPEAQQTPFEDYAGTFADPGAGLNANGAYRWKLLTSLNYSRDAFGVGLQWQHLPAIASGTTNTGFAAYDLFNLNASYQVSDNTRMRFGVDNLFDKAPPLGNLSTTANPAFFQLPGGGNNAPNYNANNYDVLGRRFYVGFTAAF